MIQKLKNIFSLVYFVSIFLCLGFKNATAQAGREYYELKIYRFHNKSQEDLIDNFLDKAYLPALHRLGIKSIGVFKPIEKDSTFGKLIYVLIPYSSLETFVQLSGILSKDSEYVSAGKEYLEAPYHQPPYDRFEAVLLRAFIGMPVMATPKLNTPGNERIYELRSYEGPTENLYINKVKMFNTGDEVGLFNRLQFNAVFYGEALSGKRMPNLMYLTAFEDRPSREAHWKAFFDDPHWKRISSMTEYQHNVSKADILLLHPVPYSDY